MARPQTRRGYVLEAQRRVRAYLLEHHAAVRVELINHLAEYYFPHADSADHFNIDPHIAGPAIGRMLESRELLDSTERTRGSRAITTFRLGPGRPKTIDDFIDPPRPYTTAQQRAAARKRLLYARYLSWTSGSASRAGTAGPAAEIAAREALRGAAGLAPLAPDFGPVARIDDLQIPGPLDSGVAVAVSPTSLPVLALIEVKNVRDWIYPNSEEIWQLVWKALHVSTERPGWSVLPILICRRCHPTLIWMAQSLGMLITQTYSAPMGAIEQSDLDPVRRELSLSDLKVGTEPPQVLRRWLHVTLPKVAQRFAGIWAETVSDPTCRSLLTYLAGTRSNPARAARNEVLTQLDERCQLLGRQGWEAIRLTPR